MKVVKKKKEDDFVLLDCTASSQEVSDALNQASQVFCSQMGLRPQQGKTPAQVASEQLGIKNLDEAVTAQAIELIVPHAVNKSGYIPAFMPSADPKTRLARGHAFQFELKVLPKPSYDLESYDPVKITIEPYKADEALIDRQVSDMARHMAEHNTVFSEGSILGVLTDFVKCVREQVLNGNTVKIDNLAIFKATVEANALDTMYDAQADKVAQATMGTLKEGDKTGAAVKVVKLLAQSTGEFTRDELKKDVKFAWTDKTKAEIAAAKGETTTTPEQNSGGSTGGSTDDDDAPGAGGGNG